MITGEIRGSPRVRWSSICLAYIEGRRSCGRRRSRHARFRSRSYPHRAPHKTRASPVRPTAPSQSCVHSFIHSFQERTHKTETDIERTGRRFGTWAPKALPRKRMPAFNDLALSSYIVRLARSDACSTEQNRLRNDKLCLIKFI